MAKTSWATVNRSVPLGDGVSRVFCTAELDFNHVAGNYVILRSDIPNPEKPGEPLKRAYSISNPPDANDPRGFHFTVSRVGPVSDWLIGRSAGDRIEFSGPWGKKFRALPEDAPGPVHLVATGTGFSPIGAMALDRCAHGRNRVGVWWQTDEAYDPMALDELAKSERFEVTVGPDALDAVPVDVGALYFLAGDGALLIPLEDRLLAAGVPATAVRTEYFFNKRPKPS